MERKISMALIEETFASTVCHKLTTMKFIDPKTPLAELKDMLDKQAENIENEFRQLLLGSHK